MDEPAAEDASLREMLEDMAAADPIYQPTRFWRVAIDRLAAELSDGGLEEFRSLPGPLSYFVPTYGFPGYHADPQAFEGIRAALRLLQLPDVRCAVHLERLLRGESQAESDYRVHIASGRADRPPFLSSFSESRVGAPVEQFEFDGRRFSRSSLNYLLGLSFLKRHCDTSGIRTVLEIGAGFGSLGEVLLSDGRNNCFYIDVDIPPTLHAAAYYLKMALGESAVLDYAKAKAIGALDIDTISPQYKAATLASWQLPDLVGKVDLFVNFISFQEMEPDVVENYLCHADRLSARYVLLRNLREGKPMARSTEDAGVVEPIHGETYDSFLGHYRLRAVNTVPFGYLTVDGFHSELRLYERIQG